MHNHVITWHPVDGSSDSVLIAGLQGVHDPEDFSSIAASGGRVGQNRANGLLRVDNEDGADSEGDALLIYIRGILVIQHVILEGDLSLLVTNYRKSKIASADLIDIRNPFAMAVDGVGRQSDQLHSSSREFWLKFCESAKLSGADRCEVFWVGEQDYPFVANELVEVDGTLSGLGIEVGSDRT